MLDGENILKHRFEDKTEERKKGQRHRTHSRKNGWKATQGTGSPTNFDISTGFRADREGRAWQTKTGKDTRVHVTLFCAV